MDWQFPRSTYSIGLMCAEAARHGMSVEACLAGTGVMPTALEDPSAEVLPQQEVTVAANILRQLGTQPGIALDIGRRFHISVYGVLAFALSSCATLREVIALGSRYSNLAFSLIDKQYEERRGEFHIVFGVDHLPAPLQQFLLDRDISALMNILVELFGRSLPIKRLEFRGPRPAHADLYRERLGLEPEFGAARNAVITDSTALDVPMPQADPRALRYWVTQLQELLERKKARGGTSGKVRDILLRQPGVAPDMEAAAAELRTTSRSLRRQLEAEGTSFRDLVDEVRQTLAQELLSTAQLNVDEVAVRLGYTDVSSFTNAFKRWTGMPPRDWRKNRQQRARPSMVADPG